MKSDSLLKAIMLSDIRKGILYKLSEKPMSLAEIRAHFNVTSASIIPRIKDLVKTDLVVKDDSKYYLTTTGTILVKKLRMMDNLEKVIERDGQFINEHDLSPIPVNLLDRIDELGDCEVITNQMENITATHDKIYGNLPKAKRVMGISPVFDPEYPKIYLAMAKRGIPVSIILTKNIFAKVEKDCPGVLKEYLTYDNAEMHVIDNVRLVLVATNEFISMYMYSKNGTFDTMNSLLSSDESAVKWGTELFEEYLQRSKKVTMS